MYQDSEARDPDSDPGSASGEPPRDSMIEATDAADRAGHEGDGGTMVGTVATAQVDTVASAEIDRAASPDPESAASHDQVHPFREELARAMQAAAEHERQRIEASVDTDAETHVQKVRARAAAEAGELKRLAEEDVAGIRGWAKAEIERVRSEADTRIGERRERLDQHLIQHGSIISGEIDRVSEAVEGYRHELDAFFTRLADEREPSEIARLADTIPTPPDFELIRAVARADAVDRLAALEAAAEAATEQEAPQEASAVSAGGAAEGEPELVPVMDPALAADREPAAVSEPVAAVSEPPTEPAPEPSGSTDGTPTELVPAAADTIAVAAEAVAPETVAAETIPSETPEPVAAAAGSHPTSDSNPATRFIRSLTGWGQSSDGREPDQSK